MSFAPPISNIPIALFPLKIETRFIDVPNSDKPNQLWIRVFPDVAFIQSHDPKLTQEELQDARAFKQITNGAKEEKKRLWETLVSKYGAYRAAWIVQISEVKLEQQEQAANQLEEEEETSFFIKWLPDRLVFSLYKAGEKEAAYEVDGSNISTDGLTLLGENDDWLLDFDKAKEIGMAVKIGLDVIDKDIEFEKLIVSGFRKSGDRLIDSNGLADLLQNHQYTEGVSFLNYGTPTNNTSTTKSGFSIKDEFDAQKSFEYAVEGFELQPESAGGKLAKDLGISDSILNNVQNADIQGSIFIELYQKATWFALGAQPLFMLFGDSISSEMHQTIWEHYTQFVNAKGRHHAFKIGNQPYGILPVINVRKPLIKDDSVGNEEGKEELFNKMWTLFALLLERWLEMTKTDEEGGTPIAAEIPRLGGKEDTYLEILKILSMQPTSSTYQIRPLKYNHFQKRWQRWLRQLHPVSVGSELVDLEDLVKETNFLFKRDHDNTLRNRKSIHTFSKEISGNGGEVKYDELFNSSILSFLETDSELIGFSEGISQRIKTVNVDVEQGEDPKVETVYEELENAFSFTQNDLEEFRTFLQKLEEGNTENLLNFQYQEELSLFTDLLLRSYSNAGQLYYRDVTYTPSAAEIRSIPILQIGNIFKNEGAEVKRGDKVLEINRVRDSEILESIIVTAPFDGRIEKIRVATDDEFVSNFALFTLKNEEKYEAIKKELIQTGKALLTEFDALGEDVEAKRTLQKEAIQEVLDVNSYRLDAWISSLANRRIEEMRNHKTEEDDYSEGIYFGAYGWVENLKRSSEQEVKFDGGKMLVDYQQDGGIIHTPNAAQATAAAIFKNSFLSYQEETESNPFTLNLTSDRIQKSTTLLNGIREGQQVEALLGYRLERFLHEHPKTAEQLAIFDGDLHQEIYSLREAFPLHENVSSGQKGFVNLSVIDGLKALGNKGKLRDFLPNLKGKKDQILQHYISKLENILDGSLDTLFYEAGYQVTQGNLSHAAAALDAIKGEIEPPVIDSLKTKTPGVGLSHRLLIAFDTVENNYNLQNCRALAEPVLEQWLAENIGDLRDIGCEIDLLNPEDDSLVESIPVRLSDLNVGYLDLMYLSEEPAEDGASELELRIWKFAQSQKDSIGTDLKYNITEFAPRNTQPLHQALETIRYARTFLDKCRSLHSEDLMLNIESKVLTPDEEKEKIRIQRTALDDIRQERFLPILQNLKIATNAGLTEKEQLQFLAQLDLESAKVAYLMGIPSDEVVLKKEIEQKINQIESALNEYESEKDYKTAFEYLQQIAKILFGEQFLILPPAFASENFEAGIKEQEKLVGDAAMASAEQVWGQTRLENWVQGLAQIYENTEGFEDWLMVKKVWGQLTGTVQNHHYQVVQGPTLMKYPWIGLSKTEIDTVLQAKYQNSPIYKNKTTDETYPLSDGTYYPDGCESTVLYTKDNFTLKKDKAIFGLVIEEFTEYIPDEKVDTAVSFHYDAPNSEAPQTILLAIHPKALEGNYHWEEQDLRDIIYDTMDLYKIRMVDLEAMQEYGYVLPMTHWMNIN